MFSFLNMGSGTASAPEELEETKAALKAAVKAIRNIDTAGILR